tara:strand:- start:5186 stop:6058 length:873 start_codon:yes stop_codon:yes gene_type:complete
MNLKNYIEFGSFKKNKKILYQKLYGNLYDTYMLSRYFKDIYNLHLFCKNKKTLNNLFKSIHHSKDLRLNFINYLFLKYLDNKKFYEFGQTLYEKIFFMKVFSKIFRRKINLKNIRWYGNDISKMFNFFCLNFHKDLDIDIFIKPNFKKMNNSIFFSKGISLLYEKNNIKLIKYIFNKSACGSFDFSCYNKNHKEYLNTGYKLYYPSIKSFYKIIPKRKNFKIMFKNIKKKKNGIYFEVIFGKKDNVEKILKILKKINYKYKKKNYLRKILKFDTNFQDLRFFEKTIKIKS